MDSSFGVHGVQSWSENEGGGIGVRVGDKRLWIMNMGLKVFLNRELK